MIKALVINKESKTDVEINICFDTLRGDVCFNAYYPQLKARLFDIRHFRYENERSNKEIASTIISFLYEIAKEEKDRYIKDKSDLFKLLRYIDYHSIFGNAK